MVQEDSLRNIRQGRERRLVNRMVEAGATVEEDQRGLLPHGSTIRHQAGTLDVKKESYAVDENLHAPLSRMFWTHQTTVLRLHTP